MSPTSIVKAVQGWFTTARFFLVMGIFAGVAAVLVGYILLHRHAATWIQEPCGAIQWEHSRLPVPVWTDSALDADWTSPLLEGFDVIDPEHKLLEYKGRLALGVDAPLYAITVEPWNDPEHGNTHHEVTASCKIVRMIISMPVGMLPGKGRVRAAAHELGHGLGLDHSDWETDVMYPKASTLFPFRLSDTEKGLLGSYLR